MFRIALLTITFALGTGVTLSAWPPNSPGFPRQPPAPTDIEGQWFMSGDPTLPCFIEIVPGRGGPMLIFTNERGEQSRGRFLPGGRQVIADDWERERGGLPGDVRGNKIRWRNGTVWIR